MVSLGSKGREGRERSSRRASSAADKKVEERGGGKITFYNFLNNRFGRGSQYAGRRNVVQHTFQDFARNMVIERSEDAAKFPSGKQGGEDVGVIFADDGDDGFGTILLMKFESESGGDGVEVAIGPRFVAALENITFNGIGSGNRNEDVQEGVVDRENRSHGYYR